MRAMDIMEMDIRLTPGNMYFCMDSCFDSYLADISISSAFGYHCDIKKKIWLSLRYWKEICVHKNVFGKSGTSRFRGSITHEGRK